MKKNYFFSGKMMIVILSILLLSNIVHGQLYINEFMASNDTSFAGPQGDYPDWIEIYNAGSSDVSLGGYYMCDDLLDTSSWYQIKNTYPDSVKVPAGGFLVFYANKDTLSSVLNVYFKLGKSGEQIGLWDPSMTVIDTLTYGQQITDTSYGLYPDGSTNWAFMSNITPGTSNANPNPPPVTLFINEFMASNDSSYAGPQGDYPDWIEIYNPGSNDVSLGGYYMCDDLLDTSSWYQIKNTYPDSVTVPAGGFLVFYANKDTLSSVLNVYFKLGKSGEQIGLWDPFMTVIDTLTYGPQITDTSFGRYPDGSSTWFFMPDITPGAPNSIITSVNEINANASVSQNFPNPFSAETTIQFSLERQDKISIKVFDIRGNLITLLADGNYGAGVHNIKWNASGLTPGFYFYTLQSSTSIITKKALIIR